MFKPFGNVIYADVATQGGQAGAKSYGWGRVKFATSASRNRAIQQMNGVNCQGRNLEVRMDAKENAARPTPAGYACYCGNLPWSVTWQQMKDLFKSFGPVTHAEIATQGGVEGGKSQGWGVVHFANVRDRDQAISQLNGTDWDGRTIEVRIDQKQANQGGGNGGGARSQPRPFQPFQPFQPQRAPQFNNSQRGNNGSAEYGIFVGNLSWDVDWKMLKDVFSSQFGNDVLYADVATEGGARDGRSKGWGTVKFSSVQSCNAAIARYNGASVAGRNIEVRLDQKKN